MEYKEILRKNLHPKLLSIIKFIRTFFPSKKYVLKYPATYDEDGLYTNHNCDFINDPLFKEAYKLGFDTGSSKGWHLQWRVYIACWLANRAKDMEGDFVECGTNRGMISRAVVHYTNFGKLSKTFYLLDSFCGLSDNLQSDTELQRLNMVSYEECFESAKETFKEFNNVVIIRGFIPDTLPLTKTNKICFLHIDLNCAAPEIATGEFFWEKLITGGAVLLDDYAYPGYQEQKDAWDIFAEKKGVQVLSLPTGQGLILKP
ncbi:MAG: hypothetical protein KAI40_00180 [Desulfobacterales bacterium]|nr:hypothetical protein [Desulfobacterales bacterium]